MTQSFIPPFHSDSPVLGWGTFNRVDPAQSRTPMTCLDGCAVDHVADALNGQAEKICISATPEKVAATPSRNLDRWLVRGIARTVGTYRTAEVGILREGQSGREAVFFDPAEALALAAALIAAVDETEALARTAVAVEL